ncbi:MAG: winged helix-turn-helix transcriptional regulator [Chloroflexi bacterium]|nr:winged helix-turn-helix transcriptional regulator [Chloroflexota bacterium]
MPVTDFVSAVHDRTIRVALEPAHIALNSLVLLNKMDMMPGINEWVERTAVSLTPEQKQNNLLVLEGFYHALEPHRSWSSFAAYLDYMEHEDPFVLRQRMFHMYENICSSPEKTGSTLDIDNVLKTPGTYLDYLYDRFSADHVNVQIETQAYHLLKDPPAMRAAIVGHLRQMWTLVLADEWTQSRPLLQSSVDAFSQIDFSDMTPTEAAHTVIGKNLPGWWDKFLDRPKTPQFIFVPSPHLGPYIGSFKTTNIVWLLFGAKLPEGSLVNAPDLSRSELLVRVNALADDTRLRIMQLLKQEGELRSQDVQQQLGLSQSAGSRHLKQLSATGYISERRVEGAKCYSLNTERIENTLHALSYFLSG